MSEYRFDAILPMDTLLLNEETFLWIWYADKIPPHLGISTRGSYFSLKYNGKDAALKTDKPLKVIHDRRIPVLFICLDVSLTLESVLSVFDSFDKASSQGYTCLDPIQKSLHYDGFKTVCDLLDELKKDGKIKSVSGLNLPEDYAGIPAYGMEEIRSRLNKLENASIGKHLSSLG